MSPMLESTICSFLCTHEAWRQALLLPLMFCLEKQASIFDEAARCIAPAQGHSAV